MRQVNTNIYKFSELSEKIQEKFIDDFIENNDFFYDFLIEEWKDKLENYGFIDPNIGFSGFCSQGDGASFTSFIDIEKFIKNKKQYQLLSWAIHRENLTTDFSVYRVNNRYYHEYSAAINNNYDINEYNMHTETIIKMIENQLEALEIDLESLRKSLSIDIYNDLQKEHAYQNSEEHIKEIININDYEFMKNGEIYGK